MEEDERILNEKLFSFFEKITNNIKNELKSLKQKIEETNIVLKDTSKEIQQLLIEYFMLPLFSLPEDPEPKTQFSLKLLNILNENYFYFEDIWMNQFVLPILKGKKKKIQFFLNCFFASVVCPMQIFLLKELSTILVSLDKSVLNWCLNAFYVVGLKSKSEEKQIISKEILLKYQQQFSMQQIIFKTKEIKIIDQDERKIEFQFMSSILILLMNKMDEEWNKNFNLQILTKNLKRISLLLEGKFIQSLGKENGRVIQKLFKKQENFILLTTKESEILLKILLTFFNIFLILTSEEEELSMENERLLKYLIKIYHQIFPFFTLQMKFDSFEIYSKILTNLYYYENKVQQRKKMNSFLFKNRLLFDCNFQYFEKNLQQFIFSSLNENLINWTKFLIEILNEKHIIEKNKLKLNLIISQLIKQSSWNIEMKSVLVHLILNKNFYSLLNNENILQLKINTEIF
eukprot:gene6699-10864_t